MRVLIAARLSQLAEGQTGLDSQDAESTAWAEREGHEVVHVAMDRKSGTTAPWDRPQLRPWVTEPPKMALYDAVLAYRLDRLSRGDNESTNAIEDWAAKNSKQLLTVDGLVFPCEGKDGIRWDVTKRIAHEEWLGSSEKYTRMTAYLRSQNKLTGKPPWGFQSAPAEDGKHKVMVPTDIGRKYIPEIFSRCIAGESAASIARWLASQGVRPPLASAWHASAVIRIIRNPAYMGRRSARISDAVYGKTILRCEPLVDAATFRRAGEALTDRPKRGPKDAKNRAMLAGCLACLRCGSPMYRITTKYGHVYYRCHGNPKSGARRKGCGNMVRLEVLDAMVSERIGRVRAHIMETRIKRGHDHKAELEEIRLEMRELTSLDLPDDEFDARMRELRAERDRLVNLKTKRDEVKLIDTGISYAAKWAGLSGAERGAWLRSAGIRVFALKGSQADVNAIAAKGGLFGPEDTPPEVVDGVALFIPTLGFPLAKAPYHVKLTEPR